MLTAAAGRPALGPRGRDGWRRRVGRRVLTAAAAAAAAEPGGRRESAPLVPAPGVEVVADERPGMAFMEKPPAGKVLLDDTVPLTAAIEASQSLQSHTVRGPPVGRAARGGPGPREGFGRGPDRVSRAGTGARGRRPRPGGQWRGGGSGSGAPGPR